MNVAIDLGCCALRVRATRCSWLRVVLGKHGQARGREQEHEDVAVAAMDLGMRMPRRVVGVVSVRPVATRLHNRVSPLLSLPGIRI
jgi:hypothetical protein